MKWLKRIFGKWSKATPTKSDHDFNNGHKPLSLGDEVDLDMGDMVEKVTVVKITPHPEVRGSVYYEFSNGVVCRDVRLH